jgi:hypothetical protein
MFDNLSGKLQRVFKNLRGEGKLTSEISSVSNLLAELTGSRDTHA